MGGMHDEVEKKLTILKAREYDKVDWLKKIAEYEGKNKHLQLDNESLVKQRNNLDIANVELNKYKNDIEGRNKELEQELEYFRKTHEDHLEKFDNKMEDIA